MNNKRPDLYVALVAPTGTPLQGLRDELRAQFASYGYEVCLIKISDLIASHYDLNTSALAEGERILRLMNEGDKLRRELKRGDAPALLAISAIRVQRKKFGEEIPGTCGSRVFLIDSLKNPDEHKTLEQIYGRNLYTISVFAEQKVRIAKIASRISASESTPLSNRHSDIALSIIQEDQSRPGSDLSQNVRDTFPKADYFISVDDSLKTQVGRFVDLAFGHPFISPNVHEYGMFLAKAASRRSADLSRQVGAAILSDTSAVISTGCNEVPHAFGGFFFEGREGAVDNRDHVHGHDPNFAEIQRTLEELLDTLNTNQMLKGRKRKKEEVSRLASDLLFGNMKYTIEGLRIRSLIEFGRVVHAEMHAICEAASAGRGIRGATMYCTTFPCHMCARHIIAAGLSNPSYS